MTVNRNRVINFNNSKYFRVMDCSFIKFRGTSNFKNMNRVIKMNRARKIMNTVLYSCISRNASNIVLPDSIQNLS